jgi:hypothetical protein
MPQPPDPQRRESQPPVQRPEDAPPRPGALPEEPLAPIPAPPQPPAPDPPAPPIWGDGCGGVCM